MDKRRIAGTMKPQEFMDVISKQTRQIIFTAFPSIQQDSTKFRGKELTDLEEMVHRQ